MVTSTYDYCFLTVSYSALMFTVGFQAPAATLNSSGLTRGAFIALRGILPDATWRASYFFPFNWPA